MLKILFIGIIILGSFSNCVFANEKLIHAVRSDDAKKVIELLKLPDTNINYKDYVYGRTALGYAAINSFHKITEILINAKADVNVSDNNGRTPLIEAANNNDVDLAKLLIKSNASIIASDIKKNTALHESLLYRAYDVFKYLVSISKNLNQQNENGETVLNLAMRLENYFVAKDLVIAGADVNLKDNDGNAPLHWALQIDYNSYIEMYETIKLFIQSKADINAQTGSGHTALMFLISRYTNYLDLHHYKELVNLLLNAGALVNLRDGQGFTPLMHAAKILPPRYFVSNVIFIINKLVSLGADVNSRSPHRGGVLLISLRDSKFRYSSSHLLPICSIEDHDMYQYCYSIDLKVPKLLVQLGAKLDFSDEVDQSLLNYLIYDYENPMNSRISRIRNFSTRNYPEGDKAVILLREKVKFLLKLGVDISNQDEALINAANNCDLKLVKTLVNAGSKIPSFGINFGVAIQVIENGSFYMDKHITKSCMNVIEYLKSLGVKF